MDESVAQTNPTGGSVSTGNPQNIGAQSLGAPSNELQSPNSNLLTRDSSLKITSLDGKPINITQTTTTSVSPPPTTNHKAAFVALYLVVFAAVFIVCWQLISKKEKVTK